MAYINLAGGLKINTADAVDSRLVLTKAEMKSLHYANDESRPTTLRGKIFQLPSNYLCVCSEDNKIYVYNALNEEDELTGKFRKVESDGGQSIADLPVVELTSETTTITDETVKAKILENVNKDNYLICKLKVATAFEILVTRDFKLASDDTFENTVFTQSVFINLGLVSTTFAFTLSINSKDGTITIAYETLGYIKDNQVSLAQRTNESFGVTTDFGDTNLINGLELYFDTINGKPIIHSDNTVNSYNIPTITFED